MRRYETIFIVRPNIGEDDIEAITGKTTSIIEGDGGTIIRIDKWGLKKLAYLIKKESQGYYVYIDYAGVPASVAEIERIFRIDDRVLKYLTLKLADSCDPEAIKEELAKAAPEETSDDENKEEEKSTPPEETSDDKDTEEEKSTPLEETSDDKNTEDAEAALPEKDQTD